MTSGAGELQAHFMNDERHLIIYGDHSPIMFNYRLGVAVKRLNGHSNPVTHVREDSDFLYTLSGEKVMVWDKKGNLFTEIAGGQHHNYVSIDIGDSLVALGGFESMYVWNKKTHEFKELGTKYDSYQRDICLLKNNRYLLTRGTYYVGSSIKTNPRSQGIGVFRLCYRG